MENHLSTALLYARLDKLPKACKGAWEGEAIVLIERIGGQQTYAIGTWNEKAQRANIAADFDHRMEQAFVEAYPIPDLAKAKREEEEAELKEKFRKEIEAENIINTELKELGVDSPEGTMEEKKAQILAIKADQGNAELSEMKKFLLELGYDATVCNRMSLTQAESSVNKMKNLQADISKFNVKPLPTKAEMEAQLKELKAAEKK